MVYERSSLKTYKKPPSIRFQIRTTINRCTPVTGNILEYSRLLTRNMRKAAFLNPASLSILKSLAKFVVCSPCQSSPSSTILVPFWLITISSVFFYFSKLLFSGFFQVEGNLVRCQNGLTKFLNSVHNHELHI